MRGNRSTLAVAITLCVVLHLGLLLWVQNMVIEPVTAGINAFVSWRKPLPLPDVEDREWAEAVLTEFLGAAASSVEATPGPAFQMTPLQRSVTQNENQLIAKGLPASVDHSLLGDIELPASDGSQGDLKLTRRSLEGIPSGVITAQTAPLVQQLLNATEVKASSDETVKEPTGQGGRMATSDDFDLSIELAKRNQEEGYVYRVTLTPKERVVFKEIRQNIYFLLDRSHSISEERYESSREAILSALDELGPNDHFSIVVFDSKADSLSKEPLSVTPDNIELARRFLHSQDPGGMLNTTDLYGSLNSIIPEVVTRQEMHTVILLSDGDTFLNQQDQRKAIGKWTARNAGKVALYSAAAGSDNNLALLSLLCTFNKGRLVYAENTQDLPNTVKGLVRRLRGPIGKELVATVLPVREQTNVDVYPRNSRMPDLYTATPYTIYGTINRIDDFYLFLQGKFYDRWLEIKYKVNIEEALAASSDIEQRLTIQRAYDHYDRYLAKGKRSDLQAANDLIASLKIEPVFE